MIWVVRQKKVNVGGGVYIYVNNINKSVPALKEKFVKNNWQVTYENKQEENITQLIVKFPFNQVSDFESVLINESSDKNLSGAKNIDGFNFSDNFVKCVTDIAELKIIDVKALK